MTEGIGYVWFECQEMAHLATFRSQVTVWRWVAHSPCVFATLSWQTISKEGMVNWELIDNCLLHRIDNYFIQHLLQLFIFVRRLFQPALECRLSWLYSLYRFSKAVCLHFQLLKWLIHLISSIFCRCSRANRQSTSATLPTPRHKLHAAYRQFSARMMEAATPNIKDSLRKFAPASIALSKVKQIRFDFACDCPLFSPYFVSFNGRMTSFL